MHLSRPRSLLLAALLASVAVAPVVDAQSRPHRVPRRILFAVGGAAIASGIAAAYVATDDKRAFGTCSSSTCVGTVTVVAGSLIGYLIGREFDELYAVRYRTGRPLEIRNVTAGVDATALGLAVRDSLVAVSLASGVQLYATTPGGVRALARRAGGVRGIAALDLAPGGALAVGSPAGFYVFPPATGPGVLLREGNTSAVATAGDRAWFGVGTRVETAPLGADTTRAWPGVELGATVRALVRDSARALVWAATDSAIVALRGDGDSLAVAGRIPTDAPARALDVRGALLVASLGEGGLRAWDVADPAAPRDRTTWRTARFVYDATILSPARVLVAAGTEGMYVLDMSQPAPVVLGLAHDLGFVTNIVVRGPQAFLLDRYGDVLRRFDVSAF